MLMNRAIFPLQGRRDRPRPIVEGTILGPAKSQPFRGLLDTGADDTVFSEAVAATIGIDPSGAPTGSAGPVGGGVIPLRYAQVKLQLIGLGEVREWPAIVGFVPATMRRPLLGFAGVLQFFTTTFFG